MGFIIDLLKEIPLSAVLKERLIEQEKLLSEIPILKAEIVQLKETIAQLKEQININQQNQGFVKHIRIN